MVQWEEAVATCWRQVVKSENEGIWVDFHETWYRPFCLSGDHRPVATLFGEFRDSTHFITIEYIFRQHQGLWHGLRYECTARSDRGDGRRSGGIGDEGPFSCLAQLAESLMSGHDIFEFRSWWFTAWTMCRFRGMAYPLMSLSKALIDIPASSSVNGDMDESDSWSLSTKLSLAVVSSSISPTTPLLESSGLRSKIRDIGLGRLLSSLQGVAEQKAGIEAIIANLSGSMGIRLRSTCWGPWSSLDPLACLFFVLIGKQDVAQAIHQYLYSDVLFRKSNSALGIMSESKSNLLLLSFLPWTQLFQLCLS